MIISLLFFLSFSYGQEASNVCNCLQKPVDCIPTISKRTIVGSDTTVAHHSYCWKIFSIDEKRRIVVLTFSCDTKPTDSFYLSFFDSSTLGRKSQTWYDTSGKPIYYTESKNQLVTECFWYHYRPGAKNYDYIIGYRNGEQFKEIYTWDKYGASYDKKVIITKKEIKTVVYTDKVDAYGYNIQKETTVPNKTGKIE